MGLVWLLSFFFEMSGHPRPLELAEDSGRNAQALFLAIHHDRNRMEVVFKGMFGPILGVRHTVTNMSYSRELERKTRHKWILYQEQLQEANPDYASAWREPVRSDTL